MRSLARRSSISLLLGLGVFGAPAFAGTYYASPTAVSATAGTDPAAPTTLADAISKLGTNGTVYLRGGTYALTATIRLPQTGTTAKKIYAYGIDGTNGGVLEKPVLDFSAQADTDSNRGFVINGNYYDIRGIKVSNAGDNGIFLCGSNNRVERCEFYGNRDSGLQMSQSTISSVTYTPSNNSVINCDSWNNYDAPNLGANADGFAAKLTIGTGNSFFGCRSIQNADDGWDTYGGGNQLRIEQCIAIGNGYGIVGGVPTHQASMNGNGIKFGSSGDTAAHVITRCMAANNYSKGFDQNNGTGHSVITNCTAWHNGYGASKPNFSEATGAVDVTNCVSFQGNKTDSFYTGTVQTTNAWQLKTVAAADFVTTDLSCYCTADANGVLTPTPRKADGSLPDSNFMRLVSGDSLVDAGTATAEATRNITLNGAPDIGYLENTGGVLLPLTATVSANSKVYDGGTTATINAASVVWTGLVAGDSVTLVTSGATATFDNKNVGAGKAVSVSGLSLGGTNASKYSFTAPTSATGGITAAGLVVTADNKSRIYGIANPALTATITGLVGGDTIAVVSGAPSLSTTATPASLPGGYPIGIALGSLVATNYTFGLVPGQLTVTTVPLASWTAANFTADELLDPAISGPNGFPNGTGIANVLAFAFGLDPKAPDRSKLPVVGMVDVAGQTHLALTYTQSKTAAGVAYSVQTSTDLVAWSVADTSLYNLVDNGATQTVTVRLNTAASADARRFLRVAVTVTP